MSRALLQRRARLPFTFQEGDVLTMGGFMRGVRTLDEVGEPTADGYVSGGFSDVPIFAVTLYARWKISPRIFKVERYGQTVYENPEAVDD